MSYYWPDDHGVSFQMKITLRVKTLDFKTQSDILSRIIIKLRNKPSRNSVHAIFYTYLPMTYYIISYL